MFQELASRRENTIFLVASYAFLAAAALVGLPNASSTTSRWAEAILLLAMGILLALMPNESSPRWRLHVYLGVQGSLVAALLLLHPGSPCTPPSTASSASRLSYCCLHAQVHTGSSSIPW
jgi:hypothetical protein